MPLSDIRDPVRYSEQGADKRIGVNILGETEGHSEMF